MAKKTEFKPNRISFKARGIITRLGDRGYAEDENQGMWQRIRFGVKTSPTNEVPVELFGYKGDAFYWSKEKGQSFKVDFEDRYNKPKGVKDAHMMGVGVNHKGTKEGLENLHKYDAVQAILDNFSDGDSVQITGQVEYSSYEKEGETVVQKSYSIDRITKFNDPIDFDKEDFKEVSSFEGTFVFLDIDKVKDEDDKVYFDVTSRVVTKKDGTFIDTEFQIPERKAKMSKAFKKSLKWGDEIKVKGLLRNEAIQTEVEDEEEDEWGSEEVAGYGKPITTYKRSMDIVHFDQDYWKEGDDSKGLPPGKGKFTPEDFEPDEFNEADALDFDDDDEDDWA